MTVGNDDIKEDATCVIDGMDLPCLCVITANNNVEYSFCSVGNKLLPSVVKGSGNFILKYICQVNIKGNVLLVETFWRKLFSVSRRDFKF